MRVCDRRAALKSLGGGLGAGLSATLAWSALPRAALAQKATLESLVFISKRLDATTEEYRDWYIHHHAPDFLSFAGPYLLRYTQDFVERGRMGDVDFDCITEFRYKSRADLDALLRTLDTPEAKATLAAHPRPGAKPGPHEDHGGSRTFSIGETLVSGPPRAWDPPGTKKQAVMLKRKADASVSAFAQAAARFARSIAGAERVALDLAVPESDRPAPIYDAVVLVWPKTGADPAAHLPMPPHGVEIANAIDLVSYESKLGA